MHFGASQSQKCILCKKFYEDIFSDRRVAALLTNIFLNLCSYMHFIRSDQIAVLNIFEISKLWINSVFTSPVADVIQCMWFLGKAGQIYVNDIQIRIYWIVFTGINTVTQANL